MSASSSSAVESKDIANVGVILSDQFAPQTLSPTKQDLSSLIEDINSDDQETKFAALVGIRKLLSVEYNAPIKKVIDSGVVPKILKFMSLDYDSKFQFESAWVITNICSGPSKGVKYVVESGGVDKLLNLLNCCYEDVIEQAIWALSNIAGDKAQYRDICLKRNCVDKLASALETYSHNLNIKKNATWALLNLVRTKPVPEWDRIAKGMPLLRKVIEEADDEESLGNALQSLAKISENNVQEVIDLGCLPFFMIHLKSDKLAILSPALAALGNIITGDDSQTNLVLSYPFFLPRLFELVGHHNKKTRKEACWAISNIAAGSKEQISLILDNPHYMETLKKVLNQDVPEVVLEVGWAFSNLASGATPQQIVKMVNQHEYIETLNKMLSFGKTKLNNVALDAILSVLTSGDGIAESNPYVDKFTQLGVVDKIEPLQFKDKHASQAEKILQYFNGYESSSQTGGATNGPISDDDDEDKINSDEDEENEGQEEKDSDEDNVPKKGKGKKKTQRFRRED